MIEDDYNEFWGNVKRNLDSGKIRMLFVADKISSELKTIVEFLNEQMNPAEVLAVEIKQYVGKKQKMLIPRVIGNISKAQLKKGSYSTKQWDEATFFEAFEKNNVKEISVIAKKILDWRNASFRF